MIGPYLRHSPTHFASGQKSMGAIAFGSILRKGNSTMRTDSQLFAAVRALPHMTITKNEGEYRVTFRIASIALADRGRHNAAWHREHAEKVSYYTDCRLDAHGTAKELSAHFERIIARTAELEAGK
ncbi:MULTISPECIES: hypothetical protein [unclassified Sphingomonas]|jgi:hypothetical protein|uniref:hypothetical protein n=1 Tax=unclassified Sphingomonas TaxID=196159 RepID=UPI0010F9B117|nr:MULTISPECIES: hypothetical protein [unclassified Sphingomonas]